jgi:serine/threonine protein phosphatase 1
MSLIAIGDVHGCAGTLDALIDRLAPSSDDLLVFVGDYVDRGPDSRGVIDRLLDLRERHRCVFLRGNHEAMMLDYLDGGDYMLWDVNGGKQTQASYLNDVGQVVIPDEHVEFIRDTQFFFETDDFFFVHAGLKPELSIETNRRLSDERIFLWERSHISTPDEELQWEKPVVCGHTPVSEPVNRPKLINIDTGCVYFRRGDMGLLTAVYLPERAFVSVPYSW